jgi:hypothetical protein
MSRDLTGTLFFELLHRMYAVRYTLNFHREVCHWDATSYSGCVCCSNFKNITEFTDTLHYRICTHFFIGFSQNSTTIEAIQTARSYQVA